jgi:hypothetical protein
MDLSETRHQARKAGLLYLLASLPAPFALLYVPSALMVAGNAAATADRVRASETLLRLGIASELISSAAFIFVVFALYRLFKAVDQRLASLMATLFLVSVPLSFLNALNDMAALIVAKGADFLPAFSHAQLDGLVFLFLRLHGQGLLLTQVFWGLWLFPLGLLVLRSGFIPRWLGALVMLAGCSYPLISFTAIVLPQYAHQVSQVAMILALGELPNIFWLAIWGARVQTPGRPSAAVALS